MRQHSRVSHGRLHHSTRFQKRDAKECYGKMKHLSCPVFPCGKCRTTPQLHQIGCGSRLKWIGGSEFASFKNLGQTEKCRSSPDQSRQMGAHPEPGSVQGFCHRCCTVLAHVGMLGLSSVHNFIDWYCEFGVDQLYMSSVTRQPLMWICTI